MMGALYASCELVGDELAPNFYAVGRREGIDAQTLWRWWRARDLREDVKVREGIAQTRQTLLQAGAQNWLQARLSTLRKRHEELLDDDNRWKGADLDAAARAAKTLTESVAKIDALLRPEPVAGGSDPGALTGAVDRALARAAGGGAGGGDPGAR